MLKANKDAVKSMILTGMETTVLAHKQAAGLYQGEQLTGLLFRPVTNISAKTGEMERNAPLFFGTGDNPLLF